MTRIGADFLAGGDDADGADGSPEGARHTSPGQRPGECANERLVLKGRDIVMELGVSLPDASRCRLPSIAVEYRGRSCEARQHRWGDAVSASRSDGAW